MKVRPLHDRILVKRLDPEEVVKGGIIVPDTAQEKPIQGKVIGVGSGKLKDDGTRQPMDVKEGDTVLYGKYSGTEITLDDKDYLILRQSDILAIV